MEQEKRILLKYLYDKHRGLNELTPNEFFITNNWDLMVARKLLNLFDHNEIITKQTNWKLLGNKEAGLESNFTNIKLNIDLTTNGVEYCKSMFQEPKKETSRITGHNVTVIHGQNTGNINQSSSSHKTTTNIEDKTPKKTAVILKILIGVITGIIVWYITKKLLE